VESDGADTNIHAICIEKISFFEGDQLMAQVASSPSKTQKGPASEQPCTSMADVAEGTASKIVKLSNINVHERWRRQLNQPCDVVERLKGCMLVGTYKQVENGRVGSLHILENDVMKCSVDHGSAVLDAKVICPDGVDRVAVVDSIGELSVYNVADYKMVRDTKTKNSGDELLLSCEWSVPHIQHVPRFESARIATSSSSGRISVHQADFLESSESAPSTQLQLLTSWQAHELECWCLSWDWHSESTLYSGADDCKIKRWDMRMDEPTATWTNGKVHSAGVTSIQVSPYASQSHLLLTGSYDEHLLAWDTRMLGSRLHDYHLEGGGVWKVRWHPTRSDLLAIAGMHAGFRVLQFSEADGFMAIASNYSHDSIAYGIDWTESSAIVSCSFYDSLVSEWTLERA